ncbi:hypothetical protein ACRW3J_00010 [Escherichia coli]
MLGGADNPNGELPSYITGADSGNYMKANTDGIDGKLSSVPGSWMVCNEITSTNDNEGIGLFQRAY